MKTPEPVYLAAKDKQFLMALPEIPTGSGRRTAIFSPYAYDGARIPEMVMAVKVAAALMKLREVWDVYEFQPINGGIEKVWTLKG